MHRRARHLSERSLDTIVNGTIVVGELAKLAIPRSSQSSAQYLKHSHGVEQPGQRLYSSLRDGRTFENLKRNAVRRRNNVWMEYDRNELQRCVAAASSSSTARVGVCDVAQMRPEVMILQIFVG